MTKLSIELAALTALALAGACNKKKAEDQPTPGSATVTPGSAAAGSGSADVAADAIPTAAPLPTGAIEVTDYMQTPESVLYDPVRDAYLVTNIKGAPTEVDDNGIVVVVQPDGSSFKWIDGSAEDIKLDAPKGSAVIDTVLWIADITVVRRFAKDGKQLEDIKIEGSSFLNDVAPDGAGGIFVTDTGVDAKFQPNGGDAIYHVAKDGKVSTLIKDKALGNPNGIWANKDGSVWVVTMGTGELYQVDAKGKQGKPEKLPKGQLDGVVVTEDGDLLVSSWEGKAVYRGKPGSDWKEVVSGVESPADIGWDPKRKRVLIPVFQGNKVRLQAL